MTSLRKMTEVEFEQFIKLSMENYKNDKMLANKLTEQEATQVAQEGFKRFLPDGFHTQDSFLYMIMGEKNNTIGHLWFVIQGAQNNKKAFITDIYLYPEFRSKGHGKEAMLLIEGEVKKRGINNIGLHVFGFNQTAIKLYQSLNYQVTDLVMEKTIS